MKVYENDKLTTAVTAVMDRLSAWIDSAKCAANQGTEFSPQYRNQIMNYSHLYDLLANALKEPDVKAKEEL